MSISAAAAPYQAAIPPDVQELPVAPPARPPAPDGTGDDHLGEFRQGRIGDCWLVSSMAAVAQDPDGARLLSQAATYDSATQTWHITFPGDPKQTDYTVTQEELAQWPGIQDDTDATVLEIAAAKWVQSSSRDGLNEWAGNDPQKKMAVSDFLTATEKVAQSQSAVFELYQQGQWSPSQVKEYEAATAAAKDAADRLTSLASSRQESSLVMSWADQQMSGLDGSQPEVALNALTGITPDLSLPYSQDTLDKILNRLAADPDRITAVLACPTDPRTNKPWYVDRPHDPDKPQNAILATPFSTIQPDEPPNGHAISVVGVDTEHQTITFRDPNFPDEPFSLSWEAFGQWCIQHIGKAFFTSVEVPPPANPITPYR